MGAAIGGRHIVMVAITIPTPRRTVALTTGGMVIIIQRLTMTLLRERMVGNRQPMALMGRQRAAPVTILIPDLRSGCQCLDALWQQKRSASLQSVHGNLCSDQTGIEPERSVG